MSLNYNILWIDDNPRTIQSKLRHIEVFLEEEGFRVNITSLENGEKIEKYLVPELDLIITDYNIHDDLDGKQLAEKVRQLDALVDIILYSQQGQTDLYKEVGTLDGVHISNRDGLEDKIKDVIKITIRKTQSVDNMRGIVISEGIDIENEIESIIIDYFGDNGKLIEDRVLEIYDFNKKVSMINSIIKRIINHYTAQLKKDDSNQTLIHDKKKQAQQFKNVTKKLNWEVVWPRNVLAHVKHDTDGAGSTYLKSKLKNPDGKIETIKIDSDWYKNTRKDLRKHLGNLENVAEFIKEWHNIE